MTRTTINWMADMLICFWFGVVLSVVFFCACDAAQFCYRLVKKWWAKWKAKDQE